MQSSWKKKTASKWLRKKRAVPDTCDPVWCSGLASMFLEALLMLTARPWAPLWDINDLRQNHRQTLVLSRSETKTCNPRSTQSLAPSPSLCNYIRSKGIFVIYFILLIKEKRKTLHATSKRVEESLLELYSGQLYMIWNSSDGRV